MTFTFKQCTQEIGEDRDRVVIMGSGGRKNKLHLFANNLHRKSKRIYRLLDLMLIKVFWITRLISKHQYCAYTLATLIRIVFLKDAFIIAARVMKEYIQQKMYFFSEKTKFFKRKL